MAIVTLGGAGHEPALSGFVGEGMLDISVVGDIFAAPGPPKVIEALRMVNRPAGVLPERLGSARSAEVILRAGMDGKCATA